MSAHDLKIMKDNLEAQLRKSSNVFIVGHNSPDFDSIGSAVGLYTIAEAHGKRAYIIVDDDDSRIEPGVKKMMDENMSKFRFIKKGAFEEIVNNNSLLIVTDVNKKHMISVGDQLDKVRAIYVIDHHNENEDSIDTPFFYNSPEASSASETVARLLMAMKIKYSKDVANFLFAGIRLDTERFKQNTTAKTYDVAKELIDRGADVDYVNNLFLQEFDSFCKISNLIINGTIIRKFSEDSLSPIQVSFTLNRNNPQQIYLKEDYAKAADRMMKFKGIDAAFAMGYVEDNVVHISARSGKRVNVGNIMRELQGGGNSQSAGTRLISDDIFQTEEELMSKISFGISDEENVVEKPQVIKVKQIRKR